MNDRKHDTTTDPAFEQTVRNLAFRLWEQEGRPQGRALEHWYAALEQSRSGLDAGQAGDSASGEDEAKQMDDNIDDLGRPASDPNAPPLDQPV